MTLAGWSFALFLLAAQPAATSDASFGAPATQSTSPIFAPPLNRTMTYHVTTRRQARDGALVSFSLFYTLRWDRAGRGYRLAATLDRIESDARPDVVRGLTAVLQPLVGETMAYLVAPDGSSIDLIDADDLWQRALTKTEAMGAEGLRDEAKQLARILAALPPAERERAATADVRALIAPANPVIPTAQYSEDVRIAEQANLRTITRTDRADLPGAPPVRIETTWTIDTATGLVLREHRQGRTVASETDAVALVEERLRLLSIAGE